MQKGFTASDFSDATYNVLDIGNNLVVKQWPELKKFPEFNFNFNKKYRIPTDKVHRYSLLLYSRNILHRTIPELSKRKATAATLSGFEYRLESKIFKPEIENLLLCKIPEANDLIIRIVRLTRNSQFEQLVVYEEARARQMRKLLEDLDSNDKTKDIHDNIKRLSVDIERLQTEILYQDNEKPLLDRLYYFVENIQLGIRPEEIAELRRSGNFDALINLNDLDNIQERIFQRDD